MRSLLILIILYPAIAFGQDSKAEQQQSFAKESKTHEYYVQQAELWWKKIEKDYSSENSWYNYYRACRNAQGTANWRTDFVDESPYLKLGDDIVTLMEEHIPSTFTYYYVKGSTAGVSPEGGEFLIKAYKMNPDFDGLLSDVVTYAESTHNNQLRKEANLKWHNKEEYETGLMTFAYNMLSSVEDDAIILTNHDNDTYPAWMLQDAENYKSNVMVLNIDFFLYSGYSDTLFSNLNLPPFVINEIDINEYEKNWRNAVKHFINNYSGKRPIYISSSVDEKWYADFKNNLTPKGIVYKYSKSEIQVIENEAYLLEGIYKMQPKELDLESDNVRVREMNLLYVPYLARVYEIYKRTGNKVNLSQVADLAENLLNSLEDHPIIDQYSKSF